MENCLHSHALFLNKLYNIVLVISISVVVFFLPVEEEGCCGGGGCSVVEAVVCFNFSAIALALESASLKLTGDSLSVSDGGGGTAE